MIPFHTRFPSVSSLSVWNKVMASSLQKHLGLTISALHEHLYPRNHTETFVCHCPLITIIHLPIHRLFSLLVDSFKSQWSSDGIYTRVYVCHKGTELIQISPQTTADRFASVSLISREYFFIRKVQSFGRWGIGASACWDC